VLREIRLGLRGGVPDEHVLAAGEYLLVGDAPGAALGGGEVSLGVFLGFEPDPLGVGFAVHAGNGAVGGDGLSVLAALPLLVVAALHLGQDLRFGGDQLGRPGRGTGTQGSQGPAGPQGVTGPAGPPGPDVSSFDALSGTACNTGSSDAGTLKVIYTPTADQTSSAVTLNCVTGTLYALTVSTAGAGTGTVTGTPGNIDCGTECTYQYGASALVTLTETPGVNSSLAGGRVVVARVRQRPAR
jgi:hypothetical protein